MILAQKAVRILVSYLLILAASASDVRAAAQTAPASGNQNDYAPLAPEELDNLVAPIALYPDALVAQVLGAATFPDQVTDADGWLKQNSRLTGEPLMRCQSKGLTEAARTRMSTSSARAAGLAISSYRSTSGGPYA